MNPLARIKAILFPPKKARRYSQLIDAVRKTKARRLLEVGTYMAVRSEQMIRAAQMFHPRGEVEFFGFDLFENLSDDQFAREISKKSPALVWVKEKLEKTGAKIELFPGDTRETLTRIAPSLAPIDVVFIDGGHSLETIESDWHAVETSLRKGSIVVFDDYWPDRTDAGAKPIVDAIDRNQYDVEILPIVDVFDNPHHGRLTIQFAQVTKK